MHEGIVFLVIFACGLIALVTFLFFNYRKEVERQTTIRAAVDKGQELTPDVVDSLVPKKLKMTGLHIGMPFVGIGIALFLFGLGIVGAIVTYFSLPKGWAIGAFDGINFASVTRFTDGGEQTWLIAGITAGFLVLSAVFTVFTARMR